MVFRKNRLLSQKDFEAIYHSGRFFSCENISVKILENKLGYSRIGFSIGIKFSKSAVVRNRIKRQLREISRNNWKMIKTGFDIIVLVKNNKKVAPEAKTLKEKLIGALEKGRIIIN